MIPKNELRRVRMKRVRACRWCAEKLKPAEEAIAWQVNYPNKKHYMHPECYIRCYIGYGEERIAAKLMDFESWDISEDA